MPARHMRLLAGDALLIVDVQRDFCSGGALSITGADEIIPTINELIKQAIEAKAPNARVAILGYPWILPATADPSCFAKMPIASGDVPYLRDVQTHLNAAVQRAAAETGATYVDFSTVSEGHDACQPSGTRWIEPVLSGTNFVPVHPNALGESQMAQQALTVLGLG